MTSARPLPTCFLLAACGLSLLIVLWFPTVSEGKILVVAYPSSASCGAASVGTGVATPITMDSGDCKQVNGTGSYFKITQVNATVFTLITGCSNAACSVACSAPSTYTFGESCISNDGLYSNFPATNSAKVFLFNPSASNTTKISFALYQDILCNSLMPAPNTATGSITHNFCAASSSISPPGKVYISSLTLGQYYTAFQCDATCANCAATFVASANTCYAKAGTNVKVLGSAASLVQAMSVLPLLAVAFAVTLWSSRA